MIPYYRLVINDLDDSGVDFVALVDEPAIMRNWQAFKNQKNTFQANKEKRIISGPLMVADLPIFRNDVQLGEHYVTFSKETITQIIHKFFKRGFSSNVNLMHESSAIAEGVFMVESFQIDSTRGVLTPNGFDRLTDGSWFGSFKVDNDKIWEQFIKTGQFKGFSVEGVFEKVKVADTDEAVLRKLIEVINRTN